MAVAAPDVASPARTRTSPVASYYLLASATGLLVLIGLAAMLSSSSIDSIREENGDPYALFKQQVVFLAIGVVGLLIASRVSPSLLKRIAPWALAASIVLLFLVATTSLGHSSGGNTNWIELGWVTAQPSEAAKLALALYLGVALAQMRPRLVNVKAALVPTGVVAGLTVGLVLAGRDIGTSVVMIMLVAAAYWTAGLPARFFFVGAVLAMSTVVILIVFRSNLTGRISAWLTPDCTLQKCYQVTHGTWALASGGIWGLGPGLSREKWSYLPKAHNDFIFAILGEEFGLVGTVFVLVALAMIVIAVNRIVRRHRDPFVQIAAAAIGAWIVGQACLNIAVVLGLAPVTGVPLPLVSSGGSSMIVSLVGLGVLLAFARREPGAADAFSARPSLVRRSLAVVSRGRHG